MQPITPPTVFISHASADKFAADQVCTALERFGIACWIAPRNIRWGRAYGEAILEGIEVCRALLLVLSSAANESLHVPGEVERSFSRGKTVLVLRIQDVKPAKSLELFIGSTHWLDVFNGSLELELDGICAKVGAALGAGSVTPSPV